MVVAIVAAMGCFRDANVMAFKTQKTHPKISLSLVERTADNILLRVTMANQGQKNFSVLKWNLPQDGDLTRDLFAVSCDGSPVSYKGKMVKRSVTDKDYLILKPGDQAATVIALAQGYDVKPKCTYIIRYHAWNQFSDETKVPVLVEMSSDELTVIRK